MGWVSVVELGRGGSAINGATSSSYFICIMTRGEIYGKYSMSTKEIPRAEPKGFPEGSGCISPYIPTGKNLVFTIS